MKATKTTQQKILAALAKRESTAPALLDRLGGTYGEVRGVVDRLRADGLVASKVPPPGPRPCRGKPPHILTLTAKGRKEAARV